jgi:hypothetical protein
MNFSERFAQNRVERILVDGREIVSILRIPVRPGDRVRIAWNHAIETPLQGIRVRLHKGKLSIMEQDLEDVVLWRDTAPPESVLECRSRGEAELRIWNCWRDHLGVMQAWVGNAGMRVEERGSRTFRLECNAREEVTFSDLVFTVTVDER